MDEVLIPVHALKGRGSATRLAHRFERDTRNAFDDGWDTLDQSLEQAHEAPRTEVIWEDARSIISSNDSPAVSRKLGFNRERVKLDTTAFRRPGAAGQGHLF